jgi:hypothetical protein
MTTKMITTHLSIVESALAEARAGRPVFLLAPGAKVPLKGSHGHKDATTDEATIRKWFAQTPGANYGIALTAADLVIDADPRNYPPGKDVLADLLMAAYNLPQTRVVKTPRGGFHFYFRKPAAFRARQHQSHFPGIDFKSEGGYVVGPHSQTPDGTYELIVDESSADLPDDLMAALDVQAECNTEGAEPSLLHADTFKNECKIAAPAVEGQNGDGVTFQLACRGHDLSLPKHITFELMRDHWNARCVPPWSDSSLFLKVENAYRYAKSAPGNATPEAKFTPDMAIPSNAALPAQAAPDWIEPKEIKTQLLPVPALTPELLPGVYRDWLADTAFRMQVPLDFVAVAALVMAGAVIGAGCGIRPKRHDDWLVIPNLWGGVIARPGALKSPALAEALKPLSRLEIKAKADFQAAMAEYQAQERAIEAQKGAIADAMKAAAKQELAGSSDKTKPRAPSIAELEKRLAELQQATKPIHRRYRTNDVTIEKLGELLGENPRGILVFRDELIGQMRAWERQGHEQDRQFFLEAWNGYGSFTVDRIGRGTKEIGNMCVSLFGGVQQSKLLSYLYQAQKDQNNDGLLQRFQLLVYPDPIGDWLLTDQWPNALAKNRAFEVLEKLSSIDFTSCGAAFDESQRCSFFRFSDQAQSFFYEWITSLERYKLNADDEPLILEHLSKYRSLMPSLALIFHLIEVAGGNAIGPVSYEAAVRASQWCAYLEAHARRIYGLVTDLSRKVAARLAEKVRSGKLTAPFTARDVYRKGWTLLDDKELVAEACEDLVEAGWLTAIRMPSSSEGGRPTTGYLINPAVTAPKVIGAIPLGWEKLV